MRFPTTFECRPTAAALPATALPDELMIQWMGVPAGATASIFLPAVDAPALLKTASSLYGGQRLTLLDAHTIGCEAGGISIIPIPSGSVSHYAGLLTLVVPPDSFNKSCKVIARQVTNVIEPIRSRTLPTRRRVLGAFEITLNVSRQAALLEPEERALAYFKWLLSTLPADHRWRAVIARYVIEIAWRVKIFGGDPSRIVASAAGTIPGSPPAHPDDDIQITGKVDAIVYDHFGDFHGFIIDTSAGKRHRFESFEARMQTLIERAWTQRSLLTVTARRDRPHYPVEILLHHPP